MTKYCRYWSKDNPSSLTESHTQSMEINVGAEVINDPIIGPYLFLKNVTGKRYLQIENIKPCQYVPKTLKSLTYQMIVSVYNEIVHPHYNCDVREFLNLCFPGRKECRRVPIG